MQSYLSQSQKDSIIDSANEREFCLQIGKKKYPAKLGGKKCEAPFAYSVNEFGQSLDVTISWALAARISIGESNTVIS